MGSGGKPPPGMGSGELRVKMGSGGKRPPGM